MRERASSLAGAGVPRRVPERPTAPRALRHHPALIDDAVAARLLADAAASGVIGVLNEDEVRWARAWLVCTQAMVMTAPESGAGESVNPAFEMGRVAAPKGLGESARQAAVLAALLEAGVLRSAADAGRAASPAGAREESRDTGVGGGGDHVAAGLRTAQLMPRVCWAPAVCAVHSASVEIDWPRVVAACGREPATLLILRTLAEYVIPADAWTGVPRRDFVERSGYQQKQVRVALRRMVAAGLVEAEGESGRTARYRFTARALAPRWDQSGAFERDMASPLDVPRDRAGAPLPVAETGSPTLHRVSRDTAQGSEPRGVDIVLGGVTVRMAPGASLDVGPGAQARIEVGPDGRLSLRVQPG